MEPKINFKTRGERLRFLQSNPPRCIQEYVVAQTDLPGRGFDGHGEDLNPVFGLKCKCGHSIYSVIGHDWRSEQKEGRSVFVGPIRLECQGCSSTTVVFNAEKHGYDVELGHGCYTVSGKGDVARAGCSSCGSTEFYVFARFEYPDDLFTDDFAEFAGRIQDLFTWFTLVGRCTGCNELWDIADFECA